MTRLYFDHNVSRVFADVLRARGFDVTTARQLGLEQATDARQFIAAVERGSIMVSHNESHFEELHDAWHRWSRAWGQPRTHHGVVILPSRPLPFIEPLLIALLDQNSSLDNLLCRWRSSSGWMLELFEAAQ